MVNRNDAGEQDWCPKKFEQKTESLILKELLKNPVQCNKVTCLPAFGNLEITWVRDLNLQLRKLRPKEVKKLSGTS